MVDLKTNFSGSYICTNCNTTFTAPTHCGRMMTLQDGNTWICWKGEHQPCCGKESKIALENCCDARNLTPQIEA